MGAGAATGTARSELAITLGNDCRLSLEKTAERLYRVRIARVDGSLQIQVQYHSASLDTALASAVHECVQLGWLPSIDYRVPRDGGVDSRGLPVNTTPDKCGARVAQDDYCERPKGHDGWHL